MYQYKAVLESSKETIAEGHTLDEIMHHIVHYKRQQKKGAHTHSNDKIAIYHVQRDHVHGKRSHEKLVKIV